MSDEQREVIEQLLLDICYQSYRHEVQYWLDAPGTDREKLDAVLRMSRDALAVLRGNLLPSEV